MAEKWKTKFELRPGRWVYVPTDHSVTTGNKIAEAVRGAWRVPAHFFHLRRGGHVAALNLHVAHRFFLRADIQDFFGSIHKTRITRCLKRYFSYTLSRDWATASTVRHPADGRWILPYGFVQSPILASLCLDASALGRALHSLRKIPDLAVSAYVDDIVISSNTLSECVDAMDKIKEAALRSKLIFNPAKIQGPGTSITAFNINISQNLASVDPIRLEAFRQALRSSISQYQINAVLSYVTSINTTQAQELKDSLISS